MIKVTREEAKEGIKLAHELRDEFAEACTAMLEKCKNLPIEVRAGIVGHAITCLVDNNLDALPGFRKGLILHLMDDESGGQVTDQIRKALDGVAGGSIGGIHIISIGGDDEDDPTNKTKH